MTVVVVVVVVVAGDVQRLADGGDGVGCGRHHVGVPPYCAWSCN